MSILSVEGLEKSYKTGFWKTKRQVLKGVSFKLEPGSVTGFLGSNGCGKTTTFKCILGLALPDRGELTYFENLKLGNQVKKRIGFLPERPYFYEYLTGIEFLTFYGQISGEWKSADLRSRIQELLKRVELEEAGKRPLRTYSKGMLQRIGIAQAILHRPELVILDEPTTGLDPDGRHKVLEVIQELGKQGMTVIFSSHILHDVETVCNHLVILKEGLVAFEGNTEKLLSRLQQKIRLRFRQNEKVQTLEFLDPQGLQVKLKALVSEGLEVLDIVPERPSLEIAFQQYFQGASR